MSTTELETYASDEDSDGGGGFNNIDDYDYEEYSSWTLIPEHVFLSILQYLSTSDTVHAGQCCRRWNVICKDDYLWRKFFQRDFKVAKNIGLKPGAYIIS